VPFDLDKLEVAGAEIPILDTVFRGPGSGAAEFAVASQAGTLVYAAGGFNRRLVLVDRDSGPEGTCVQGIGETPVFPSVEDPSKPSSRHAFQQWLKRANRAGLRSIEDPEERDRVRREIRGVGYPSEKRAGVQDPKFRKLPAAIQEEIAGTNYTTLRRICDEVTVDDIREAWSEAKQAANSQ